jgi:hypothetical protein
LSGLDFGELVSVQADPKGLVRSVAAAAGWQTTEGDASWEIVVPVGPLRKQLVHVRFDRQDAEGDALITFHSTCGPATRENAMAFLRYNTQMVHGAFAIEQSEAGEMIVVEANQLADTADAIEVARAITAVAWQADKVEEKLLGVDEH